MTNPKDDAESRALHAFTVRSLSLGSETVPAEGWVEARLSAAGRADVGGNLRVIGDLAVDGTIRGNIDVGTVQADDIADNAVLTAAIADGAVTNAKLAGGCIDAAKIIDGSIGPNQLANAAVTNAKIADNSVNAAKIVNSSVGTSQIANAAVTTAKIADNSVNATKIADGSVGNNELGDGAVTTAKLAENSVNSAKVADGSIGSNKLADAAVTTVKLADNSVSAAKIADGSIGKDELANEAVTLEKLAPNSVNATKIAESSIGLTKLASEVRQSVSAAAAHAAMPGNPHGTTAVQVGAIAASGGGYIEGSLYVHSNPAVSEFVGLGNPGHLLYATVEDEGTWGLYINTNTRPHVLTNRLMGVTEFTHQVKFLGGKVGYVVDRFINASKSALRTGDVVKLRGTPVVRFAGALNRLPIPEVTLADKEGESSVIGIVHLEADPDSDQLDLRTDPNDPTVTPEGGEVYVVTLGAFAHCKVDASEAPIEVGDLLTSSSRPGFAKKATKPKLGSIIGKALEPLKEGTGYISVYVNIQ